MLVLSFIPPPSFPSSFPSHQVSGTPLIDHKSFAAEDQHAMTTVGRSGGFCCKIHNSPPIPNERVSFLFPIALFDAEERIRMPARVLLQDPYHRFGSTVHKIEHKHQKQRN